VNRAFLFAPCALVAALSSACVTDTTATGVTPIPGIVVRSDALTAGHGCGTADGQVYKYLAVLTPDAPDGTFTGIKQITSKGVTGQQSGLYDCYADATFGNLLTNQVDFHLAIFAFDAKAYAASATDINKFVAGSTDVNGATLAGQATTTTECTAQSQASIDVLAVCDPLQ
jgi:hypothetical protein